MTSDPGIGAGASAPWYRVVAIPDVSYGGSAERDYAAMLPALLDAAHSRRTFVTGWLSRGGGAPLEFVTNAGPLPSLAGKPQRPAAADVAELSSQAVPEQPAGRQRDDEHPYGPPGEFLTSLANRLPQPERGTRPHGRESARANTELLFPWGARGVPCQDGLMADLDTMVWAPCPGRQAPPPADAGGHGRAPWPAGAAAQPGGGLGAQWLGSAAAIGAAPTLFETALTTLMGRPFGWLVVAEPTDLIDAEIADLRAQLTVLRRFDEEQSRFDADRAASRLAELDAFHEAGLWHVRVLVGAAGADQLSAIAPMLVGSADLGAHPYRLRGPERARDLADALAATSAPDADGSGVPLAATAGVLAALAGLPRREVPGVRLLDVGYFDVTAEPSGEDEVSVGTILDGQDRPVGTLGVSLATLNRHALVTGATGSGKSQTVRHLLEQLTRASTPWLVVEPVKSEYAAMAGRIAAAGAELTLISPADPDAIPLAMNPLAPEPGYPVQAHIDMVRALFLAAFDAHEPFPQIMSQALQRVYESCGWDPVSGSGRPGAVVPPAVPTLAQLQAAAIDVITDVGYGPELQADVRGFVDVRLRSLRTGSAGRFFEGGHPADVAELLRRNAVLAIEDVANDEDKAFLIGTLIIRITEHLRLRQRAEAASGGDGREQNLRHVIVIEEAHRLLRAGRDGASAHAVELFASLLAEIRAYGEGLVIAEQIPAKLVPDVVKNTALKIVHRLPASDDRDLVGATMNLDAEQSRQVVSFPPGVAAVFADGMDRPLRVKVPFGGHAERPPTPAQLAAPPMAARRSAACGPECAGGRACSLLELRSADLLAESAEFAWLRVWTEAVVLAFLTNSPLPVVPVALRSHWSGLDARLRECALATITERAVASRSRAIRDHFPPGKLTAAVSAAALRILNGGKGAGTQVGREWVIPQLQWLHEIERALPLTGPTTDPFELALPLEFELPGLVDRPDIKIGQRVSALRRHPLSMELDANRLPAWTALLGDDDQRGFAADLATLAVGSSHRGQLLQAAGEMGVVGWLEPVLSWPRRFIVGPYEIQSARAAPN
ncbi:MAG TPA: ATP-binding protein [Streptosporangiaceae bacterium]|nr:ATP-binding protein [Streptosporangiaceae bacterium]